MRHRIASLILGCAAFVSAGAQTVPQSQNLPSAPAPRQETVAEPASREGESNSALPLEVMQIALRDEQVAAGRIGQRGGVIWVPVAPPPPAPPRMSTPTAMGILLGGTVGGVWGFNLGRGEARSEDTIGGMLLGALAGALVGHIYHDLHMPSAAASQRGNPAPGGSRHCRHKPPKPGGKSAENAAEPDRGL
jgi:hypothetical protein